MEGEDDDLTAMSSATLSQQMSSVVRGLEKSDPTLDTFIDYTGRSAMNITKKKDNEQPMDLDECFSVVEPSKVKAEESSDGKVVKTSDVKVVKTSDSMIVEIFDNKVVETSDVKGVETSKENEVENSEVKAEETSDNKAVETFEAKEDESSEDNVADRVAETSMDVAMGDNEVDQQEDKGHIHSEETDAGKFSNVQIQVIDVPDDDDLFDFLRKDPDTNNGEESNGVANNDEKARELRKSELYRYLTANDPHYVPSNEVTPYQSGEESDTSGQSDSIEYLSTDAESDHDESVTQDNSTSRCETPVLEEEPKEVRRKPGRKQTLNKSTVKKESVPSGQLSEKTREKLEKCKVATKKWLKDLELPQNLSLDQPLKFEITDLNQYLTCGLCKGYLYEASTITECMHTFCKNCIVRHCMEVSLHCPVCNILIHPTDPFVHIRLDRMIQDIVYKMLPKVAETEFQNMKDFYAAHPEILEPPPQEISEPPVEREESPPATPKPDIIIPPPQLVSILLESESKSEADDVELEKRFVRVVARATIENVCTFLKTKLSLHDDKQVSIYCCGDEVDDRTCTLENVQTRYFAEEDPLVLLQYRVTDDAIS